MEKILKSNATVRFQDCDPFNHLNNSKYIDYFLNAREDQISKDYDLNIYQVAAEKGISWVVSSSKIAYFKPALLMENVLIESQLIRYSEKDLTVEMRMWDKSRKQLKSFIWVSFMHYNIMKKSMEQHNEQYMQLFEKVIESVPEIAFDDRYASLISATKMRN